MNARERREADEELAHLGLKVDLKSRHYQYVMIGGEETRVPVSEGIAESAMSAVAKTKGIAAARATWRIYEPLIRAGRASATGYASDIAYSDMWRFDAAEAAAGAGVSDANYRRFFDAFVKAASKHAAKLLKDWQKDQNTPRGYMGDSSVPGNRRPFDAAATARHMIDQVKAEIDAERAAKKGPRRA